eukprot:6461185-Lingulodinium_polyedra.AAC.1
MVRVNTTVAYNQDTGIDEEALLLRVPPGCASAIAQAITNGFALTVEGRTYRIGPLTALGTRNHRIPDSG